MDNTPLALNPNVELTLKSGGSRCNNIGTICGQNGIEIFIFKSDFLSPDYSPFR